MLIKCPECWKEFSDKAPACPGCGCPVEEAKKIIEEAEKATDPDESSVEVQTESQSKAEVKSQTEMPRGMKILHRIRRTLRTPEERTKGRLPQALWSLSFSFSCLFLHRY